MSLCFISHAGADGDDPLFESFLADFSEELRGQLGATTTHGIAFRAARDVPIGALREVSTRSALLDCRVFLALLSPTYLRQPECRREWAWFAWRLHSGGNGAPSELLLPLVWIPIAEADQPPAIKMRQLTQSRFGAAYAARGLRYLARRADHDYRDVVGAIAAQVCELTRRPAAPSSIEPPPPNDLADPFAAEDCPTPEGPDPTVHCASPAHPRRVVLFLAADAGGKQPADRLALDEECAAIERELRMTAGRDDFDFRSKWAVTVDELMRHLNELRPAMIHFSGHGYGPCSDDQTAGTRDVGFEPRAESAGIYLRDEHNRRGLVEARALRQIIASAAPSARIVFLNACFSEALAGELCEVVDCVVGMSGAIADEAARAFAVSFYRALGYRHSVGNAVAQAVAALAGLHLDAALLPKCHTRRGVHPHKVTLTAR